MDNEKGKVRTEKRRIIARCTKDELERSVVFAAIFLYPKLREAEYL